MVMIAMPSWVNQRVSVGAEVVPEEEALAEVSKQQEAMNLPSEEQVEVQLGVAHQRLRDRQLSQ